MGHHKSQSEIPSAHFVDNIKERDPSKFGVVWAFGSASIFARRSKSDISRKRGLKTFSLQIYQKDCQFDQI